jgi:hypothetical protein
MMSLLLRLASIEGKLSKKTMAVAHERHAVSARSNKGKKNAARRRRRRHGGRN